MFLKTMVSTIVYKYLLGQSSLDCFISIWFWFCNTKTNKIGTKFIGFWYLFNSTFCSSGLSTRNKTRFILWLCPWFLMIKIIDFVYRYTTFPILDPKDMRVYINRFLLDINLNNNQYHICYWITSMFYKFLILWTVIFYWKFESIIT